MEFVGKLCQLVMSGVRRLWCGDDEQDCVMVDAVGSGHLAVSECRLNIGHAIPSHTTPYHGLWMAQHSATGQCTIEYWLGPLGRANCPGAPSTLLLNHITLYCDQRPIRRDPHSGNSRTQLT